MNNFDYKNLTPFKWFVLENFPFIENDFDAINNYHLFSKVVEYLNKTIDNMNITGEQMENVTNAMTELQIYVDNLDVQEEVNEKLDEMASDGTLEEIINQEIFAELNEKIDSAMLKTDNQAYTNITLERTLRTFEESFNNPDRDSSTSFPLLQGGCYVGNNKMVICSNKGDNNNRISEISLIDGSIIRSINDSVGHGNSIAFNNTNNKLYITGLTGEENHTLFVMNYTTFTFETPLILNTLNENENIHSVSYDYETNKSYILTETSPSNYLTLYELNISDGTLSEINIENYDNILTSTNTNDMCVYNDIVYIMKHDPQLILTYKVSNNKLQNLYNIDNMLENGTTVGELQNISVIFDSDYKDFIISSNKLDCNNGYFNMFQYFKCNFVYNLNKNIRINNYNTFKRILVDINSTSINPDGSSSNRYKYLSEALENANKFSSIEVLASSGTYPFTSVESIKGRVALGGEGGNNITINGFSTKGCNYIYLFSATVNNTNSNQDEDIYSDFSNIRLSTVSVDSTKNKNIRIHNGTLELNNVQNSKIYSQSENSIICYDNIPSYKIADGKIPTINKPVKLFNGNMSNSSQSVTYDLSDNLFKNCQNLKIMVHGNYGYNYVSIPNIQSNGTRLFPALLGTWYTQLELGRNGDNFSMRIFSSRVITNNTDNTSSATGDFVVYAEN